VQSAARPRVDDGIIDDLRCRIMSDVWVVSHISMSFIRAPSKEVYRNSLFPWLTPAGVGFDPPTHFLTIPNPFRLLTASPLDASGGLQCVLRLLPGAFWRKQGAY
jgi:hypothetical protein